MAVIVVALALPVDLYITHLGDAEKRESSFRLDCRDDSYDHVSLGFA